MRGILGGSSAARGGFPASSGIRQIFRRARRIDLNWLIAEAEINPRFISVSESSCECYIARSTEDRCNVSTHGCRPLLVRLAPASHRLGKRLDLRPDVSRDQAKRRSGISALPVPACRNGASLGRGLRLLCVTYRRPGTGISPEEGGRLLSSGQGTTRNEWQPQPWVAKQMYGDQQKRIHPPFPSHARNSGRVERSEERVSSLICHSPNFRRARRIDTKRSLPSPKSTAVRFGLGIVRWMLNRSLDRGSL